MYLHNYTQYTKKLFGGKASRKEREIFFCFHISEKSYICIVLIAPSRNVSFTEFMPRSSSRCAVEKFHKPSIQFVAVLSCSTKKLSLSKTFFNNHSWKERRPCLRIFAITSYKLKQDSGSSSSFLYVAMGAFVCVRTIISKARYSRQCLYRTRDIYYANVLPLFVCQTTLVFVTNCNADDCGIAVSETCRCENFVNQLH